MHTSIVKEPSQFVLSYSNWLAFIFFYFFLDQMAVTSHFITPQSHRLTGSQYKQEHTLPKYYTLYLHSHR
jgi:hypothetical protein